MVGTALIPAAQVWGNTDLLATEPGSQKLVSPFTTQQEPHFIDANGEAQRGYAACPRSPDGHVQALLIVPHSL